MLMVETLETAMPGEMPLSFNTGMAPGTLDLESASGGLVGKNTDSGNIRNSYAVGLAACIDGESCTGDSEADFGGLVGENNASISNSYWSTETAGSEVTGACGDGACTGATDLTTAQMQALADTCADGTAPGSGTCTDSSTAAHPSLLGDGFQLTEGEYPKVKKCTTCTGTLEYSDELVAGQE